MSETKLTVGMAVYQDFSGCYFSVQALNMYQNMKDVEILVIDNYGCKHTEDFVRQWVHNARYIRYSDVVGTAMPRNEVFKQAKGKAVLCIDSHVMLKAGAVERLVKYFDDHPDSNDLIQGPMIYDDIGKVTTHMTPVWRDQMFGTWSDVEEIDDDSVPFEIPMHGLGLFGCRKEAWLGFNEKFTGFGGEEGYIHQKYEKSGRKTICLPFLKWLHRFNREGAPYPNKLSHRVRNYLIGWSELGLDTGPIIQHFSQYVDVKKITKLATDLFGDDYFKDGLSMVVNDLEKGQARHVLVKS